MPQVDAELAEMVSALSLRRPNFKACRSKLNIKAYRSNFKSVSDGLSLPSLRNRSEVNRDISQLTEHPQEIPTVKRRAAEEFNLDLEYMEDSGLPT